MSNFFRYFFSDIGRIFHAFLDIFSAILQFFNYLFNFPMRFDLIREYAPDFGAGEWFLVIVTEIVLLALTVLLIIFIVKKLRKLFRFRIPVKKYEEMEKQVKNLQHDLLRANYEKDRLLRMRIGEIGIPIPDENEENTEKEKNAGQSEGEQSEEPKVPENRNTFMSPPVDPETSRFYRLTVVDNFYKTEYVPPVYDNFTSLAEICERFRNYTASRLGLYYDLDMMRHFIASMGTARIIILQGISGTGKTSLPYAFGKFVGIDSTVVSVQPSWRERTELYGYFNEFTKKYTETDFLRAIYEANYYRDPHIIILDEMNIARVEYYFAEMLSILELPQKEEWKVDVVNAVWDNDPCLIRNGKISISDNVWFVGTINNDDSTFSVADKVYDRAIPIDLDSRAEPFECPPTDGMRLTTDY
ncbi:MAG: hypothetical protein IJU75_01700, partial [Clostridia bacterium]|nr:hypothetical protein [Clostridia bacterium]